MASGESRAGVLDVLTQRSELQVRVEGDVCDPSAQVGDEGAADGLAVGDAQVVERDDDLRSAGSQRPGGECLHHVDDGAEVPEALGRVGNFRRVTVIRVRWAACRGGSG
jgi:hypothetical protein